MSEPAKENLGQHLRKLRRARDLTLQEVSDASREAASDPAGCISNPYLSQIESGASTNISFAKLHTLALIYGVSSDALIGIAPLEAQNTLRRQQATMRASGLLKPSIEPLAIMGLRHKSIIRKLFQSVAAMAENVSIPINDELACRDAITETIIKDSCVPAWLPDASPDIAEEFVERYGGAISQSYRDNNAESAWTIAANLFKNHLLYGLELGGEIIQPLTRWTIDFPYLIASCHFHPDKRDRLNGYDRVPYLVVRWVAEARIASFVRPALDRHGHLLPPPDQSHSAGARAYLKWLVETENHAIAPAVMRVASAATALCNNVPELANGEGGFDPEIHEAVTSFLCRVAQQN